MYGGLNHGRIDVHRPVDLASSASRVIAWRTVNSSRPGRAADSSFHERIGSISRAGRRS
ncbi:hypothetical protein [Streptomyces sp. NPDC051310]|uniref:hypothetical protein n=1 Tax=Streptomyces sp. NPDC051310 TaxID=3365649 RepID=UPI0037B36DB0